MTFPDNPFPTKEAVTARIAELQEMGFKPGYMGDVRVGDIIAKAPEEFSHFEFGLMAVTRVEDVDGSYYEPEEDVVVRNRVMRIIGFDENDLERHIHFGSTHSIYLYRSAS